MGLFVRTVITVETYIILLIVTLTLHLSTGCLSLFLLLFQFQDVVVNHDLSDPQNLPQKPTKTNPAVSNLRVIREHYKGKICFV